MWEQNVAQVLQDEYILGIGYKWKGESKVYWKGLPDFPLYKKDPKNDRELVIFIASLIEQSDQVIGHKLKSFDMKKIRARMLYHKLPPLSEPRVFDTKTEVKKKFSYISNKLDDLSRQLLDERKLKHEGIQMWTNCMSEKYHSKDWKMMGTYCKQDVLLTDRLHELCFPWSDNNLNWNLDGDRPKCCPACGNALFGVHGEEISKSHIRQKYRCRRKECHHVWRGEIIKRFKNVYK